jgi:hypothetical protein
MFGQDVNVLHLPNVCQLCPLFFSFCPYKPTFLSENKCTDKMKKKKDKVDERLANEEH